MPGARSSREATSCASRRVAAPRSGASPSCAEPGRPAAAAGSPHSPQAPQRAVALLDRERGERTALAGTVHTGAALGSVARAVVAAHQRVAGLVEEMGVAEI